MKTQTSLVRLVSPFVLVGLFAAGCGDSGHGLGQANGGNGGGGQTGSGSGGSAGGGGKIGTGGTIGTGGSAGPGGHGGTGGGAGHGAGGAATGGSGTGGAGHGGSGGSATGGSGGRASGGVGGAATGGAGGQGGQGGAMVCSSSPLVACPASEVCDYDTPGRCGAGYEPGHCIVLPGGCTADYAPVCGCDGHTYGNDCTRKMARVQLDHTGACTGGGGGAGGSGAFNCGGVLTCDPSRTYCYAYTGGIPTVTTTYSCNPSPSSCTSAPTCGCVCPASSAGCTQSPTCTCTEDNGLTKLDCYGG